MNKKVNTVLFILAASLLNVLLMVMLLLFGILLLAYILPEGISPSLAQIFFILVFLGSIALTFFIYHRAMKIFSRKVDMDKYFDPIIRGRRK
jgi:ABC-type transport system involved in multi-copper enzyme maturation permease subunit